MTNGQFLLNSIYLATEGEGQFIGTPQIFVRFQGCTIGCLNCDSKDTWDFSGETFSLSQVLSKVHEEGHQGKVRRVSITGGDPLHPQHVPSVVRLVRELKSKGYFVNIEAAGTRIVHEVFDLLDFISFDYKTPSTGVKTNIELISKLNEQYPNRFQVKSVIETEDDFREVVRAFEIVNTKNETQNFSWFLTPSYNLEEDFPKERFENVIQWNQEAGAYFRVVGQQHKWIHGPDLKQV